jgi:hypothetical protein
MLSLLHGVKFGTYREYIYNFLGQSKAIVKFLTTNTLRFVKYKGKYSIISRVLRPVATWWKLLQRTEFFEISDIDAEYCRKYQLNIELELMIKSLVSKMAMYSAYFSFQNDKSFQPEDVSTDILSHINDNDLYCGLMETFKNKSLKKRKELRKLYLLE